MIQTILERIESSSEQEKHKCETKIIRMYNTLVISKLYCILIIYIITGHK